MKSGFLLTCFIVVVTILPTQISSQGPPRLSIPGAVFVDGPRPRRIQPQLQNAAPIPFRRKAIPNALPPPQREVRPVFEEREEIDEPQRGSILDEEVARLTSSALNSVRQVQENEQQEQEERIEPQRPLAFRPERPLPVTRENVREHIQRPQQPIRQEAPRPIARPAPPVRQQPIREQYQRPKNVPLDEEEENRRRKPPVQILRKYRTDNEDGSITWGFENEDGTFKEENIGNDCIIRGKYGYVDPDGEKREFSYEAGNKCDEPEEEELDLDLNQPQNIPRPRAENNLPGPRPQFRPQYKP